MRFNCHVFKMGQNDTRMNLCHYDSILTFMKWKIIRFYHHTTHPWMVCSKLKRMFERPSTYIVRRIKSVLTYVIAQASNLLSYANMVWLEIANVLQSERKPLHYIDQPTVPIFASNGRRGRKQEINLLYTSGPNYEGGHYMALLP